MKTMLRPLLLLALMAAGTLSCSLVSNLLQKIPAGTGASGDILFQDDFSDTGSGWTTLHEDADQVDYQNGVFSFQVNSTQTDVWSNPELNFGDVHITVDATKVTGTDDNDFGILCRYQDEENFYGLLISSDGYYGISKMKNGSHELLGTGDMSYSDIIRQGKATNRIEADCSGDTLTLSVNGQEMLVEKDADFTSGDVGLLVGTFDTPGTNISFDNFFVTQP